MLGRCGKMGHRREGYGAKGKCFQVIARRPLEATTLVVATTTSSAAATTVATTATGTSELQIEGKA